MALLPSALLLLLLAAGPAQAEDLLFLGNSYTQFNDLDVLSAALLTEVQGSEVSARKLTAGGLTFGEHLARVQGSEEGPGADWALSLGDSEEHHAWVFLQEQSQIPGFPEDSEHVVASRAAARGLDAAAEAHGAETVFLLTWGRRSGDETNPDRYPDFETMQAHLTAGYLAYVADTTTTERPTWVAPVGLAFALAHSEAAASGADPLDPDGLFWRLYSTDGSHPSLAGSYLAALVVTATITGEDPAGWSSAPEGLDAAEAASLRGLASRTVFEATTELSYPWSASGGDEGEEGDGEEGGSGQDGGSGKEAGSGEGGSEGGTRCHDDCGGEGCSSSGLREGAAVAPGLWLAGVLGVLGMGRRRRG